MADVVMTGLPELKAAIGLKAKELTARAMEIVAAEVEETKADAVNHAPRLTGDLQDKIEGMSEGLEGRVTSKSTHSSYVENGSAGAAAQPFMAPAAEAARSRFPRRAETAIKELL